MKNSFKMGALALVIAVSFAACKGSGSSSTDTTKVVTDTSKTVVDTTKKVVVDTVKKADTAKKADTTKKK